MDGRMDGRLKKEKKSEECSSSNIRKVCTIQGRFKIVMILSRLSPFLLSHSSLKLSLTFTSHLFSTPNEECIRGERESQYFAGNRFVCECLVVGYQVWRSRGRDIERRFEADSQYCIEYVM